MGLYHQANSGGQAPISVASVEGVAFPLGDTMAGKGELAPSGTHQCFWCVDAREATRPCWGLCWDGLPFSAR